MSEELESCPFCGSDDVYVPQDLDESILGWVFCRGCEAQGPAFDFNVTEEIIIKGWNTRTASQTNEVKK